MGRGSSKGSGSSTKSSTAPATPQISDFDEAFAAGQDFEASGDVDHYYRTASAALNAQWRSYTDSFGQPLTSQEEALLMKEWDPRTGKVYGYVRTTNSFAINSALYDPANDGKTDAQIFTRRYQGQKRDLMTVQTLDKSISTHQTPADASYVRFSSASAIQATFGLSSQEMQILASAKTMTPSQLAQLNKALGGKTSFSKAYTSTSANRSMNAFKNPSAKQSKGFDFERRISTPKGTHALAVKGNAQESEVIFGRRMQTKLSGVSIASDGHIVLHESFDGYK